MNFYYYPTAHTIIQNPCIISNLLKWIGSPESGDFANALMMWDITVPTCSIASAGDFSFVASFTGGRFQLVTFNSNDRSKMSLYYLLLCCIIANDENFKVDYGPCFMSSHHKIVANPCADFPRASTWISATASYYNAKKWGTFVTADSISSGVQSRPTETGHLTRAYCSNKLAARCWVALRILNKRPCKFPSMTPSGPVKSSSNRRRSSANAVAEMFFY